MSVRVSASACAVTATVLLAWGLLRTPLVEVQGPGEGLTTGGALQGTGSAGLPLGLVGGSGITGRRFLGLGAGSAAFGWLTAQHDATLTGTGSAGAPLARGTAPLVNKVGLGLYGLGSDGACQFDGVTTPVADATLAGSTYTLTRDVQCDVLTVQPGVRVFTASWRVFAYTSAQIDGTLDNAGRDATASAAGAAQAAGYFAATRAGANQGVQLATGTNLPPWYTTASNGSVPAAPDGAGANGTLPGRGGGGGAGLGASGTYSPGNTPLAVTQGGASLWTLWRGRGDASNATTQYVPGQGGSGGALVAAGAGGFGGAVGGVAWLAAPLVTGSGTISARGGNGSARTSGNGGGGGGGAGGLLVLIYNTRAGTLTLSVAGGTGGLGSGTGTGGRGGDGAAGTQYLLNMSGDGT